MKTFKTLAFMVLAMCLLLTSCETKETQKNSPVNDLNQTLVLATLYYQHAAEMKALSYQAYNLGKLRLDEILAKGDDPSKLAIVLDIDETVLDNSPFEAQTIKDTLSFPDGWNDWVDSAKALPLPGAVEFLNYADSKGVQIFYITNRDEASRAVTAWNLTEKGFPQVVDDHLLLKTKESGKEKRRQVVQQNHKIILLFGDNLADFDRLFDKQPTDRRNFLVDSLNLQFGDRFIMLPNPMYGDWLSAFFDYKKDMKPEEKLKIQQDLLEGFK